MVLRILRNLLFLSLAALSVSCTKSLDDRFLCVGCHKGTNGAAAVFGTLSSLEVSLNGSTVTGSMAVGTIGQLSATGIFSTGVTQDVTSSVTWSSSNSSIATVDSQGRITALQVGTVIIQSVSSNGVTDTISITITPATLSSVGVTILSNSIPLGLTSNVTATGIFSDNSTQDLTGIVTWASSNPTIASVNASGLVTALATGSATITASYQGKTGQVVVTSTSASLMSIGVTPVNPSIALGLTEQFTATGIYSDSSTQDLTNSVAWSVSDLGVANVASNGLASSLSEGTTTVSASLNGKSGSSNLTVTAANLVSIAVSSSNGVSLALGVGTQLTVMGTYSNGSVQDLTSLATFSSSNAGVVGVSNAVGTKGLVTTVATGSSDITASLGAVSGSLSISVTAAQLVSIGVAPANESIAKGLTLQLTAIGVYSDSSTSDITSQVTWASSNNARATISNATGSHGLVSTINTGAVSVTATLGSVVGTTGLTVTNAALISIGVTPANPTVALGTTVQLVATGVYSDASTLDISDQVTWTASNGTVASISNASGSSGLVSSLSVGSTTMSAALSGVSGSTTLTVTNAALVSISITPGNSNLSLGLPVQLTATGTYTDNSTQDITSQVVWTSNNVSVATVSNVMGTNGLVSTVGVGTTTIGATLNGISNSASVTVTSASLVSIAVTPVNPSIAKGLTEQFIATGTYTDNSTQDITSSVAWSSSNTAVASVSNAVGSEGLALGSEVGSAVVSATLNGKTGTTTLTVTAATLVSISVTPPNPSIALGLTEQLTAVGTYTDGSTQDITNTATWMSSQVTKATVSNASGSIGLATSQAVGSTVISATLSGKSGSTTLTINNATLVSIGVTPAIPSVALGLTEQFIATGVYTDNSTQDISASVTWTSSAVGVATISNAVGSEGLASTVSAGVSTISAALDGKVGSATLTVTSATLVSISITPANFGTAHGLTTQMTATGTYTNASTEDITTAVTWTSANNAIVTVSNASGSNGVAYGASVGATTVSATLNGITGSTNFTVSAALLASITVTPTNPSVALGLTRQFTATGTDTAGNSADISNLVTWASSNSAVASISNASGSQGLASSNGTGSTTVSAVLNGVTGSTTFTVTSATLVSMTVSPSSATVPLGVNQQFTASGTYTDNSVQSLTSSVTWSSSDTMSSTVSNASGSNGLASSVGVGSSTITAIDPTSGVSASTALTVTSAELSSIAISISKTNLAIGEVIPFTVMGTHTNGVYAVTGATCTVSDTCRLELSGQTVKGMAAGVNMTLDCSYTYNSTVYSASVTLSVGQ